MGILIIEVNSLDGYFSYLQMKVFAVNQHTAPHARD
ncbi:Uncharacterised protein [Legionella gratiana]|uniref:Uncharacterized protein n=1 Tax=Legionella gratiana TaxID=45066 RepID=A0A378J0H8_9GAMM|nr:Uncharacterised protein [Legionella gratiana]